MPSAPPIFSTTPFEVAGRTYHPPARPVVVVCVDGCADEYLSEALARGRMPALARLVSEGYRGLCRGALPSFTNVNNAAIVCGSPPSVTGVSGNFFLDPESGEEVMMNDARFLREDTILAAAARAGRKVAMVTAKDKLRGLLSGGLEGIAMSAEKAGPEGEALVGRPTPEVYSGDLSLFVLDLGAALLARGEADFLYLTLSDYVQHKHAPDEEPALAFYGAMDERLARYLDAGAAIGLTADHGMNGKTDPGGEHRIVWLQTALDEQHGVGAGRVILPITDPYVVHHGALGGFGVVHLAEPERADEIASWALGLSGITEAYPRAVAADKLELPPDRIGDVVVLSARDHVIGKRPQDHDLSLLGGRLRSHGGRYEEMVPLVLSTPLTDAQRAWVQGDPRSFDLFSLLCSEVSA
jgi:phosphonoacetate hydrolase